MNHVDEQENSENNNTVICRTGDVVDADVLSKFL